MEIPAESARNPTVVDIVHRNTSELHQEFLDTTKNRNPSTGHRLEIINMLIASLSANALRNAEPKEDLNLDMLHSVVRYVLTKT